MAAVLGMMGFVRVIVGRRKALPDVPSDRAGRPAKLAGIISLKGEFLICPLPDLLVGCLKVDDFVPTRGPGGRRVVELILLS